MTTPYNSDPLTYEPQPEPQRPRFSLPLILAAVAVVIGIAAILIAYPKVKYSPYLDSGVAFCKAAAEGDTSDLSGGEDDGELTEEEYRKARAVFDDSRDADIRKHGTALMDAAWAMSQASEEDALAMAFLQAGTAINAVNGLTGACAKHGYTIKLNSGDDGK